MKQLILPFLLTILAGTAFAQDFHTKVGEPVPSFSFEKEKGKKVKIEDYKGRYVLLNFFATWCPPCNAELPEMQKRIWDAHGTSPKFSLFVLGREEGWAKLDSFKLRKGFTFPIVPDEHRGVFGLFAASGIPRNVIIDPKGKIIYQEIGYTAAGFDHMVHIIDSVLNKK